jgi:hypothetical protein
VASQSRPTHRFSGAVIPGLRFGDWYGVGPRNLTLLLELQTLGLDVQPLTFGVAVKLVDPAAAWREFRFLRVDQCGRVGWSSRLCTQLGYAGYSTQIAFDHWGIISQWIPESRLDSACELRHIRTGATLRFPISLLADQYRPQYLRVVQQSIEEIDNAAGCTGHLRAARTSV